MEQAQKKNSNNLNTHQRTYFLFIQNFFFANYFFGQKISFFIRSIIFHIKTYHDL